jgi:hypothetical protein
LQLVTLALLEVPDAAREQLDVRAYEVFLDVAARRAADEVSGATRWEWVGERPS